MPTRLSTVAAARRMHRCRLMDIASDERGHFSHTTSARFRHLIMRPVAERAKVFFICRRHRSLDEKRELMPLTTPQLAAYADAYAIGDAAARAPQCRLVLERESVDAAATISAATIIRLLRRAQVYFFIDCLRASHDDDGLAA